MRRIHYGSITIDVTDSVGDMLIDVSLLASERRHFTARPINRGMMTAPFFIGSNVRVRVSGYLNDGPETEVDLILGTSIPVAVSELESAALPPHGTDETLARLRGIFDDLTPDE